MPTPTGPVLSCDIDHINALRTMHPLLDLMRGQKPWTNDQQIYSFYVNDRDGNNLAVALCAPVIKVAAAVRHLAGQVTLENVYPLPTSVDDSTRLEEIFTEFRKLGAAQKIIAEIYVEISGLSYQIFLPPKEQDQITVEVFRQELLDQYRAIESASKARAAS